MAQKDMREKLLEDLPVILSWWRNSLRTGGWKMGSCLQTRKYAMCRNLWIF